MNKQNSNQHEEHSIKKLMFFKIVEALGDALTFAIFSFLLMSVFQFWDSEYKEEIFSIFSESIAPKTITLLFTISIMGCSLVMLCFGKHDPNKKVNDFLYRHLVFKVASFGQSFSIASFGMVAGLTIAVYVYGNSPESTLMALFASLLFLFYFAAFASIFVFSKKGVSDIVSAKTGKAILVVILLTIPVIYLKVTKDDIDKKSADSQCVESKKDNGTP